MVVVNYFNLHRSTVRKTAEHFGISKSSVHRILTEILPNTLSREILDINKLERHHRGGQATKNKYLAKRSSWPLSYLKIIL